MSWDEVEAKFLSLGHNMLEFPRLHEVSARVRELERLTHLSELANLLRSEIP